MVTYHETIKGNVALFQIVLNDHLLVAFNNKINVNACQIRLKIITKGK